MLSGNCTEALSIQANVTISGSSAKLIKNGIAPLPFPLPALLKQYCYIKGGGGERVRVRGHAPFYATLGSTFKNVKNFSKLCLQHCWKFIAASIIWLLVLFFFGHVNRWNVCRLCGAQRF